MGYSLIHQCAFYGAFEILKYLVNKFKDCSMMILQEQNEKVK